MRRIGRGWAPKMGLAPLCFLEGGCCQGNGGDRCPSPTPLHLLLILSALWANAAPRSCRVNRPSGSTYYAPDTSRTEQSPFSWGSQARRRHGRIPLGTHKRAHTLKRCCSLCLVPEVGKRRCGWGLTTASKINKRLTSLKQAANVVLCFQKQRTDNLRFHLEVVNYSFPSTVGTNLSPCIL